LNNKLWERCWNGRDDTFFSPGGRLTEDEWKYLVVILYADEFPRTMYKGHLPTYSFCVHDHINYPGDVSETLLKIIPYHFANIIHGHDYHGAQSFLMCYNLVDNSRNKDILTIYDLPLPLCKFDYNIPYKYLEKYL
jgi:hypothetical protein